MALVGWISYQKTKGSVDDKDGYFLAGRGLTGTFIAGSMLLTNLSAEQLIGFLCNHKMLQLFNRPQVNIRLTVVLIQVRQTDISRRRYPLLFSGRRLPADPILTLTK